MNRLRVLTGMLASTLLAAFLCAAEFVEEKTPDGKLRGKYSVDERGRKLGAFTEYYDSGKVKVKGSYKGNFLDGLYAVQTPAGRVVYTATYKDGLLHGPYTILDAKGAPRLALGYKDGKPDGALKLFGGGKASQPQEFKDGEPPLTRPPGDMFLALATINSVTGVAPKKGVSDLAADRREALRRLQSYRAVAGVPWEGLELDDELNRHTEAAAQICEVIGKLDHRPPNPGWPDDKYKFAYKGTSSSNLFMGSPDLSRSVDGYMDDSDKTNIDRVGHRRWCLNPMMLKTGFGRSGKFSAMWSFDGSRKNVADYDFVAWPPPGIVPGGYFGDNHAWHVAPNPKKFRAPTSAVKVKVFSKTDRSADKPGDVMTLNYMQVNTDGFGGGPAIIFRPDKMSVAEGARYRVEIDGLQTSDGKAASIRYFVVFLSD